jgi:uncharacterized protein (TIGR00369 family)
VSIQHERERIFRRGDPDADHGDSLDANVRLPDRRVEPGLDGIFHCFHGGLLAMLADSTGGSAVLTVVGAEAATATTDLSIRFLAPCKTDARATARVIHTGNRLVIAEVDIHDMDGRHIAVSQATYMRLRKRG